MTIHLLGEAAAHEQHLREHLDSAVHVHPLPREAATDPSWDEAIAPDDVVVALRFRREPGTAPPFRLLHVPGAGLDGVDLEALDPSTTVANVFEHEVPIAEFVLARMLEWEIRAGLMQESFEPQAWSALYRDRRPHGEIYGKSLGLVGYGRVGRAIAARAAAFGMTVRALDDHASDETVTVWPTSRLDDLLDVSDFVVLACPLTEETRGLIGARELERMGPRAVLVNVSRAEVVEQDALYAALEDRRVGGAILDVWYRYPRSDTDEPHPADRPFWNLPTAWCTPHSSAWTQELSVRRYRSIADNIRRLVDGAPLHNVVRAGAPPRPASEQGALR